MEREQLSIILNLVTALLFVISEVLGLSKCEANGVVHLVLKGFACLTGEKEKLENVKVYSFLISQEPSEESKKEFVPQPLLLEVSK